MNDLLQSPTTSTGPVECLGQTFSSDQARREHFLRLLAEKLKDPEFRKQEGFPQGTDEAILAMSDPPYYTACPNPWLPEFVKHYGKPYDPSVKYSREPLAIDVSVGMIPRRRPPAGSGTRNTSSPRHSGLFGLTVWHALAAWNMAKHEFFHGIVNGTEPARAMLTDTKLRNLKPTCKLYKLYKVADRDGLYVAVTPLRDHFVPLQLRPQQALGNHHL